MVFTILILSAVACGVLAWPVRRILLNAGVVDRPNARSSHTQPTVRGGGIAIMAVLAMGAVILAIIQQETAVITMMAAALVLACVSFIDDLRSVSRLLRFGCHAACAFLTLAVLGFPQVTLALTENSGLILPLAVGLPLLFLWIAGYTNAFNFMDGINGMATIQAIVTSAGTALLGLFAGAGPTDTPVLFAWAMAGAAAGFLPYNFPRARMFMGDVGSAPLGYFSASLVVWFSAKYGWSLFIPLLLIHANFILDTSITLLRRLFRGETWYDAHREHFYQRLVRSGKTHTFVTSIEMVLQLIVLALMFIYLRGELAMRLTVIVTVVFLWSGFFCYAELCFCRRGSRDIA